MCLILAKEANAIVDQDKIKTAVLNNPDGWGYVIPMEGVGPVSGKFFDPDGTNPDDVLKFLEDAVSEKVYLHLRYTTIGETSFDNCHPFDVLKKDVDGQSMYLMHNGTLHNFKPDSGATLSDTAVFTNEIVVPLAQRFAAFDDAPVLEDPLFTEIIDKYINGASKVVLIDEIGNDARLGSKGHEFKDPSGKKWWVSNTYSFNPKHRTPTTTTPIKETLMEWNSETNTWEDTGHTPNTFQGYTPHTPSTSMDYAKTHEELGASARKTIIEEWSLDSLNDLCSLSAEDLQGIVIDHPDDAVMLILALQEELYNRGEANA